MKIQKKMGGVGGRGLGSGVSGWGDQAECKRRIEVFGKIHQKKIGEVGLGWEGVSKFKKKIRGGSGWLGWGVRVDVNEELKFCENSRKNIGVLGRGGRGVGMGADWGVGLGGQVGCERRIEVFVRIQKK